MSNNYSTDLESSSSQYFSSTDANLGANFPGKASTGSSSELTVEFWVKFETLPSASHMGILNKFGSSNSERSWQIQALDSGSWNVTANNGSGGNDGKTFTNGAVAGTWIHVAWTWKGSTKEFKMYENGTQIGSTLTGSNASALGLVSTPLTVGAFSSSSAFLDGKLNNVRVWSVARTQTEIDDNKEVVLDDETGLQLSVFNETNDGTDLTSNNNDLTNNNTATFSTDVPFSQSNVANITIDSSKVDADLTDYPVYINLADLPSSFWDTVANGGGDIRVYKSDGTTQLAREVVSCDTSAETGELHVKYTGTLSSSTDTVIQIWADGSSSEPASDSTYGSEAVWDDYWIVSHNGGKTNSSSISMTITSQNSATASNVGKIGEGTDFNGTNQSYTIPSGTFTTTPSEFTLQAWIKDEDANTGSNRRAVHIGDNMTAQLRDLGDGTFAFGISDGGFPQVSTPINDDTWYLIHGTVKNVGTQYIYKNGVEAASLNWTKNIHDGGDALSVIGSSNSYTNFFGGIVDELRSRPLQLSADWISTEYNNQNSPSTFYSASDPALIHIANITIQSSKVDADLTDYPVYVDLSDMPNSFWDVVTASGGDIRIFKNDDSTELAREIVSIDTSAKTGELHLKYTGTLSSSSNTVIHIFANGSSTEPASDSTYGSEAVWGSNYKMIQHMEDNTTSTILDSTSNSNDGDKRAANSPTETTGIIGKAQNFDRINDDISITDDSSLQFGTGDFTLEAIVNVDNMSLSGQVTIISKDYLGVELAIYMTKVLVYLGGTADNLIGNKILYADTDYNIVLTRSGSTISIYINGAFDNSGTNSANVSKIGTAFLIGNRANYSGDTTYFEGIIDEARILNTALSADWISTEYNNQNSPSTFYTASDPAPSPTNTSAFFAMF